jgi:hypothetical protein
MYAVRLADRIARAKTELSKILLAFNGYGKA